MHFLSNYDALYLKEKLHRDELDKQIERAEARLEKLREKRSNAPYSSWVEGFVEPLAKQLAADYGLHYAIYGPFGLDCQTTIYLIEDPDVSITEQTTKAITFRNPRHEDSFMVDVETGTRTNRYPKNSIGDINGMNNDTVACPFLYKDIKKLIRTCEHKCRAIK